MGLSLAQEIIDEWKSVSLPCHEVVFDYSHTPVKVALLERLVGESGWMRIDRYTIESSEPEDSLLISCYTDDGKQIPADVAERMFSLNATEGRHTTMDNNISTLLERDIEHQKETVRDENQKRNQVFFDIEIEKLSLWADDVKIGLEKEISDLDAEIRLRKAEARKLNGLEEKVAAQREIKEIETSRSDKRRKLFEAQDDIDARKDKLFDEVEQRLRQKKTTEETLFILNWTMK